MNFIEAAILGLIQGLLGIADWVGKRNRKLPDLTIGHGILYGLAQTLALIPGVSRSGATTTMGLFLGYTRPAAAVCLPPGRPRRLRERVL